MRRSLLVTPITPADTGNGLAMRAGLFAEALAVNGPVDVAIVAVSGRLDRVWIDRFADTVVDLDPVLDDRSHIIATLGDVRLRTRLAATQPLPDGARFVPPTLAASILEALSVRPDLVLGFRLTCAPVASELARLSGARLVLDSDDDDTFFAAESGDHEGSAAHHRLGAAWFPDAELVTAASADDIARIAERHGLGHTAVIPNAITAPAATTSPPGHRRLLFLGNLTYDPNATASRELATEILPVVRTRHPTASLELVGAFDDRLFGLARKSEIQLTGSVPSVADAYERADVVVMPLRAGSGTRLKAIEAFAHRRPVVSTARGVAGLGVEPGVHYLRAETKAEFAAAIDELWSDPVASDSLVERAALLAAARFGRRAVVERASELLR